MSYNDCNECKKKNPKVLHFWKGTLICEKCWLNAKEADDAK